MTEFDIDFRYPYGTKGGGRSSSISVSDELKCALDDAVGEGNKSAFMERASWLLLALLQQNASAIESWRVDRGWGWACAGTCPLHLNEWAEKNTDITLIEDSMLYFVYGDEYKLP